MKNFPDLPTGNVELHNSSGQTIPVDLPFIQGAVSLVEKEQSVHFAHLEVVYVDNREIVRINKEYLNRDYITDIISFRYDEDDSDEQIEGTLFCCVSRISEQSSELGTNEKEEFSRIILHGLLHLCGYDDDTEEAKSRMTELENRYLHQLGFSG